MKNRQMTTYENIDWNELWRNGRKQKSWHSKGAEDWDRKAASFSERNNHSPYIALFLSRLPLDPSFSILDVGCGPGTLALPLAVQVDRVTAIDYSEKMLDALRQRAEEKGLTNISCVHCSWESDWQSHGIEPADIAIASRSMNVADLSAAIDKLNAYGSRYVFISDRIAPSPFDPEAFAAIGRDFNSGPDYIFTLNLLYSKGIHANVEILQLDPDIEFKSMEEALQTYRWMFKEITDTELGKLKKYLESRIIATADCLVLRRRYPPRWAMIWWKQES